MDFKPASNNMKITKSKTLKSSVVDFRDYKQGKREAAETASVLEKATKAKS